MGHSQAAAGIVSVMRALVSLQHNTIAKTIHVDELSPHIQWEGSGLHGIGGHRLAVQSRQTATSGGIVFGLSGTNAHLILEEAPSADVQPSSSAPWDVPLLLSGKRRGEPARTSPALGSVVARTLQRFMDRYCCDCCIGAHSFYQPAGGLQHEPSRGRSGTERFRVWTTQPRPHATAEA